MSARQSAREIAPSCSHSLVAMSPPHYVQACTLLAEGYLLSMGVRDLVAPGQPLSLPGDVAVMGLYGDLSAGTLDGKKALALSQFFGALMVALGLLKLVTVFTNPEGTYLRRNLMLAIGVGDLLIFAFLQVGRALSARC